MPCFLVSVSSNSRELNDFSTIHNSIGSGRMPASVRLRQEIENMLRISKLSETDRTRLKLEGKLTGLFVDELENCWSQLASEESGKRLVIDLSAVDFIDASGKVLLARMHQQGAKLEAKGCLTKSVIEAILRETQHQSKQGMEAKKKGPKPRGFSLVLLFFLFPIPIRAQSTSPLRLTLQEAVQMAIKQNPLVQIANLTVAQSERDKDIVQSGLLPQVGAEVYDSAKRYNAEALLGRSIPGFRKEVGPFQQLQAGGGFSVPVFDLTLWRRFQAAKQGIQAGQASQLSVREQTVLLVVSQYLGAQRAAANVRSNQSRVKLAQALYDQAADLQKNGVGTGLDTLRANVQLQNEKQLLIVAETQREIALFGLAKLLNLNPQQNLELLDELAFFEIPAIQVEQTLEQAFSLRPELRALDARERIIQFQKSAASDARLPKITATGNWGYQGLSLSSSIPSYTYQVTMDMPLFTGGRIRAEKAKADLELQKVQQEKQDLKSLVTLQVKTAMAQLESARHEVEVANLAAKLAEDEVSQSRDRFQAGVANNIEIVNAQDSLARANNGQIAALYRYNQARADLAHATGQVEKLYLK
jgi:outer membrane protein TolC/anti-anti-sigma regulatory factor